MNKEKIIFDLECLRDNFTDNNFKDILNNAIDYIKSLHQLEEKAKVIEEILDFAGFDFYCPHQCFWDEEQDEYVKVKELCSCRKCKKTYKECWLKYFENKASERGKNVNTTN